MASERKESGASGRRWWVTVAPSGLCVDVYDDREQATTDAARYERSVIEVVPAVVTDDTIERAAVRLAEMWPADFDPARRGLRNVYAGEVAEAVLRAALEAPDKDPHEWCGFGPDHDGPCPVHPETPHGPCDCGSPAPDGEAPDA